MAFDYKKEQKSLYAPKKGPSVVEVPKMQFVAVRGAGNPNEEGGAYKQAVGLLYAVSYTLKMSYKTSYQIEGFFQYVVPPLEGFWWQPGVAGVEYSNKDSFNWISCIRVPDFVTPADFEWAVRQVTTKKGLDCSSVELLALEEGLCVQALHVGPYDDEPATVAAMAAFAQENGYVADFSDTRMHHEIYLSDPRRTAPEKLRTIIRHPVRKA